MPIKRRQLIKNLPVFQVIGGILGSPILATPSQAFFGSFRRKNKELVFRISLPAKRNLLAGRQILDRLAGRKTPSEERILAKRIHEIFSA